jgi:predicted transposase/invertase (TIGR01784 family)
MDLLHPTEDIVFKLLFADPRNEPLLVSLLESVLQPRVPIEAVTVLNPEIAKENVEDKGVVLDVLVRLADGTRVNIEMQCDRRGAIPERWLYSWARLYSEGIRRGDAYLDLAPVVCIVFLDASTGRRFHSVHRVVEIHDHTLFTDALAIHVVELPRLADPVETPSEEPELVRWARFLRARSPGELESLATGNPIMAEAKKALERLSSDPDARALAEARLKAQVYLTLRDKQSREEGREEGASAELREAIHGLCEVLGLAWTEERRRESTTADVDRLREIAAHLRKHRDWP